MSLLIIPDGDLNNDAIVIPPTTPGGGATITTQDEGITLSTTVTTLNFVGAGVTASGAGATTTVTIPGGASTFDWGKYIAGRGNWPLG